MWPAAPSEPELTERIPAAGDEGLALAVMLAAEFKTRYMVVRTRITVPSWKSTCTLGQPRRKSWPRRLLSRPLKCGSSHLSQCSNQLRPPSHILNQLKRPPELRLWGLLHLQGLR